MLLFLHINPCINLVLIGREIATPEDAKKILLKKQ
jgi:hypothetical protein